jgi:uncharacterized peroxidase-related enzyme
MARLNYVDKETAKPEQEKILSQVTQKSGKIANIWKLWSHSPLTLETFIPFYKTLMRGSLDGKLRELAYIKTSLLNDCPYCAEGHKAVGRKVGITEQQLQDIASYESSNSFTPVEKLVLRYAEELTRTVKTSESLLQELKKHLSEEQLVELNLTVGTANLTNRFNMSFLTDPDT